MKKLFLIFNLFFGITFLFSQNTDSISLRKTKFISFSPKKNLSDNVNGINVGVLDAYDGQKMNGFNLQFNPIVIIYPLLPKAIPAPEKDNGSVVIMDFIFLQVELPTLKKLMELVFLCIITLLQPMEFL